MLRKRTIIAFSLSLFLVGGALWFRFVQIPPYHREELISLKSVDTDVFSDEEVFLADLIKASSTPQISAEPLTQTDLVSRQLFSDYIELSSGGNRSLGNIKALASKYAESILKNTEQNTVKVEQLIIVPNSEESLSVYGKIIMNLRNKNKNLISLHYGNGVTDINSLAFQKFILEASELYQDAVNELLLTAVPAILADNHIALINNYLSSSRAMQALSKISSDPISAYTALNTQAKNTKEEDELLLKIQIALISNGIIFGQDI